MKAWAVDRPGPVDGGPLVRVDKDVPRTRAADRSGCVCACAACAGPTSTWPRATSRHAIRCHARATRSSASSTQLGTGSTALAGG